MSIKSTPLTEIHSTLGAKMAEFAGYNMPISYSSIIDEHEAVRNSVGLFDVSHMGEFVVKGKEALKLIQSVISNDASTLLPGQAQYAYLPNDNGGIVDDLLVYRLFDDQCAEGEQAFMLVVNASNIDKDWEWISKHNHFDTRLINISEETCLLALQGPKAIDVLQQLVDYPLDQIKYYNFIKASVGHLPNVIISATGYTGSGGFELYANKNSAVEMWNLLISKGIEVGIKPCGLGARDTLRLEKGFCLYGNDIDDTTSPLEAGLGWVTKLQKDTDFPSKQLLVNQKLAGLSKKLVGFKLNEKRVPRHGYEIFDKNENPIGVVTSGTSSPTLEYPIGLGYVPISEAKIDNTILISFGKKMLEATICKVPFV
jgi:aminomethyltransferase